MTEKFVYIFTFGADDALVYYCTLKLDRPLIQFIFGRMNLAQVMLQEHDITEITDRSDIGTLLNPGYPYDELPDDDQETVKKLEKLQELFLKTKDSTKSAFKRQLFA